MAEIRVKFWGVRGSVPSPGPSTAKYGGNTSCVSITFGKKMLILDAGTGIRDLGTDLSAKPDMEIFILITHSHWDHIQGFPFFKPIYQPDRPVYMFPTLHKKNVVLSSLVEQMDGAHFPVTPDQVPSNFNFITEDPLTFLSSHGFDVDLVSMNHPGGAFGYRVRVNQKIICYFTDNEIDPPYPKAIEIDALVENCNQADVLIHDAQYNDSDMPAKHGWGHSLIRQVSKLGHKAKVNHLVYFHHEPERTDDELDAFFNQEQDWLKNHQSTLTPHFAYEGLEIKL